MKKILYPNLVAEMARHGESQRDLGAMLGLPHESICRRLSGKIEWSISEIDKLCEHYEKNYHELFKKND